MRKNPDKNMMMVTREMRLPSDIYISVFHVYFMWWSLVGQHGAGPTLVSDYRKYFQ